jgi:energy-coupling factor transport system permease protein
MIATKLAFVVFCWTVAFLLPTTIQVVLMHIVFVLGKFLPAFRPSSKTARRTYVRFLAYAGGLAILIIFLNSLFIRSGEMMFDLGPLRLWTDGFLFGLRVSARLVLMSVVVLLFFLSTPLRDFAGFLEMHRTPRVITSVFVLSLEFLERVPRRIQHILLAQEARGAPVRAGFFGRSRGLIAVVGPLILSSLVESIERSHALALRGFQHRFSLPRAVPPPLSLNAWFLCAATVLVIAWSIAQRVL